MFLPLAAPEAGHGEWIMPIDARPQRTALLTVLCLVALFAVGVAPAVRAQAYLPLTAGTTWVYQGTAGAHETQTVTGITTLLGHDYAVITYSNSTSNTGLENYWSTNAEGDVFLAGFNRALDNFGVVYDPPLLYVDAPLALGKTWSSSTTPYFLPGMTPQGPFTLGRAVYEETGLDVPAGHFATFGIGQYLVTGPALRLPAIAAGQLALDGTLVSPTGAANEWFAAGVGQVQYVVDDRYQLVSLGIPTPVAASTWGRVKAAYRQ
jgi:hypothetical protein